MRNVAQEKMKHRPELQSHTANWRRPTRSGVRRYRWSHRNSPRVPTEPNAWGDAPPHKRNVHQWRNRQQRHGARGATMRRDWSTRPTQRNGWGHAQDIARERQQSPPQKWTRAPPRRSEGWNEWVTPIGPPTQEQTRERWPTPEGEGPSREGRTLANSQPQGGSQQAHRQPQVAKRIVRQRPKPHPKEKAQSPKNNLLTGGRAEQVDLEADLRPGEHNGENQEPPKARSFIEDHLVRGRQRLQGASRATDQGTKPQPAESRARYPRQPQTRSKGRGGNTEPQYGTVKDTGGS